jgi:hypothetical protein
MCHSASGGYKNRGHVFVCVKTLGACRDAPGVIFDIGGLNGVKDNGYDVTPQQIMIMKVKVNNPQRKT